MEKTVKTAELKTRTTIREVRFCLSDDFTHCYVLVERWSGTLKISHDWHHKAFHKDSDLGEVLGEISIKASTWPQLSPVHMG